MEISTDNLGTSIVFPNADNPMENDAEVNVVLDEGGGISFEVFVGEDEYAGLMLDLESAQAIVDALQRAIAKHKQ